MCVESGALVRKLAKNIQAKSRYLNENASSAAGSSASAETVESAASDSSADAPTSDSDSRESEISCGNLLRASRPQNVPVARKALANC